MQKKNGKKEKNKEERRKNMEEGMPESSVCVWERERKRERAHLTIKTLKANQVK